MLCIICQCVKTNGNKRRSLKICVSALRTTKDKCCFHTHAVLSVQRGALFLVLFHIKWQICLFGNQHVCVVCCRTKIAGSCCTLVSHSFLHLVCKVKVVRAVWNGIFIHRPPHGKGKGAEKLILEHPRSMKHVRRHSLHRHWHSLIHPVLSSVHRIIDVRDCKR